eukprot:gene27664-49330_t
MMAVNTPLNTLNISAYKFVTLEDAADLRDLRDLLRERAVALQIKGTILL